VVIDSEDITPDDASLIKPGAVFYWSVGFFDYPGRGRSRESRIRFRRLKGPSKADIARSKKIGKSLLISSHQIQPAPPDANEIEISLFGPGFGECCVIHLGSSTKQPASLSYLQKLRVDPAQAVKLFVISHWHSDHIKGASEVASKCENSQICFSNALLKDEFLTLVNTYSGIDSPFALLQFKNNINFSQIFPAMSSKNV